MKSHIILESIVLLCLLVVNDSFAVDFPNSIYQQTALYFQQYEPAENMDFPRKPYKQVGQYLQQKRTLKALSSINQLIAESPSVEQAYTLRRKIYTQLGEIDKIILDYQQLIHLKPYVALYRGNLGWLYLKQGEFSKAQAMSLKAHELDRSNFAWATILGHCYFLQGDAKKANHYYQQALLLLETTEQLEQGPLADFDFFIKKIGKLLKRRKNVLGF